MKYRHFPVIILLILSVFCMGVDRANCEGSNIEGFYDRIMSDLVANDPEELTYIGDLSAYGIPPREGELTDVSDEARHRRFDIMRKDLAELRAFDRKAQTPAQLVTTDTLDWALETELQGEQFMYHDFPADYINGAPVWFIDFMTSIHEIKDRQGAENYIRRLARSGVRMDQELEGIRMRTRKGIFPSRTVAEGSLGVIRRLLPADPVQCDLYTVFAGKLEGLNEVNEAEKASLRDAALHEIRQTVYPAYQRIMAALLDLIPKSRSTDGVWALPDGDAYYRYLLHYHTTTDLSPEEVHQIGLREVARLQAEMMRTFKEMGLSGDTVARNLAVCRQGPGTRWGEDALREYEKIVHAMQARLPEMFDLRPAADLQVQSWPASFPGPNCYVCGNLEGTRLGVFRVNLSSAQYLPAMKALSYHEGVPGHHLQMAFILEQKNLPLIRRSMEVSFTASLEGWALYAERLAGEFGCYTTPQERIEALHSEYLRALRLVVDTGIHYKRWTRTQARQYFMENMGTPMAHEVDRYIAMPGQACSYMIGMLKTFELRERARRQLGERFDIREFHNVVLTTGSVPLPILEREVDRYIASKL